MGYHGSNGSGVVLRYLRSENCSTLTTFYTMSASTWSTACFLCSVQLPTMYLTQVAPQLCPVVALSRRKFFGSEEMARERSCTPRQDTPNLGIFFGEGSHEFDQFGTMQEDMRSDPDVFAIEVGYPISSSQGNQSQ